MLPSQIFMKILIGASWLISPLASAMGDSACKTTLSRPPIIEIGQQLTNLNTTDLVARYFYVENKAAEGPANLGHTDISLHPISRPNRSSRKITDRLNIEAIMTDFSLNRLQAVEVQALLRRFAKNPNDDQFRRAIDLVRQGNYLSGLDTSRLAGASFLVAMDADGTLIDQDTKLGFIDNYHTTSFLVDETEVHHVAINQEAISFIRKAKELGALVVLFSRNNDSLINGILEKVEVDGKPLRNLFDGVFTSSHMVVTNTKNSDSENISSNQFLHKDLSMFGVERVMIVDDDESYVLQKDKVRRVPFFNLEKGINRLPSIYADPKNQILKHYRLTAQENERKVFYFQRLTNDYALLIQQVEFLAQHLDRFNDYLATMSPLGEEAIRLLSNTDTEYSLENHTAMNPDDAKDYLYNHPEKVREIIMAKKVKKGRKHWWSLWG